MSRVLSAAEVCALALGAIGQLPVTETAASGEDLRRAMSWLDLRLADLVGTERVFSRLPSGTLSFAIVNGTQSYNLEATLGVDLPTDRIQYIVDCYIEDADGNRSRIEVVTKEMFENVTDLAEIGKPTRIHIDQNPTPTLRIFPTPPTTDTTVYRLHLVVQRYAPNVAPSGVTGTNPDASVLHDMGQAWQLWMVCQLAHDLGAGPITKIGEASLNRFAKMAGDSKERLLAFTNREHETTPPICASWGM